MSSVERCSSFPEGLLQQSQTMQIRRLSTESARDHLLLHNIVDANGKRIVRKGVRLKGEHLLLLAGANIKEIEVAILDTGDVWEDEAARRLTEALQTDVLETSWGVGGRANLHTTVNGVLYVDADRLLALNLLPGITLATLPQYSVVHPRYTDTPGAHSAGDQVATLKIIPYAIPQTVFAEALALVQQRPLIDVRPLPSHQVALLISGDPAAHRQLQQQFESPTRQRLTLLGSELVQIELVAHDEDAVAEAVQRLLVEYNVLIIAGQTSIMDEHDLTLRALRRAGVVDILHGAPVDPGNLLAVGWWGRKPILCAPGCARSMAANVVDLVLPRLLVGERLGRREISLLGMGGMLR